VPYVAFDEILSAPPAMPLSALAVDEDESAGESVTELAP